MNQNMYSIRMRAALGGPHENGGRHISGAERIVPGERIPDILRTYEQYKSWLQDAGFSVSPYEEIGGRQLITATKQ